MKNEAVKSVKKPWQSWAATLAIAGSLCSGCAGVKDVTVLKTLPPNKGDVEVRLAPRASKGELVVVMQMRTVTFSADATGMPDADLLEEAIEIAKSKGANVLVVECAPPGTVGAGNCNVQGYVETTAGDG